MPTPLTPGLVSSRLRAKPWRRTFVSCCLRLSHVETVDEG